MVSHKLVEVVHKHVFLKENLQLLLSALENGWACAGHLAVAKINKDMTLQNCQIKNASQTRPN